MLFLIALPLAVTASRRLPVVDERRPYRHTDVELRAMADTSDVPENHLPDRTTHEFNLRAEVIRNNAAVKNRRIQRYAPQEGDRYNCLTREWWSQEKKEWCCENKELGCPEPPPSPLPPSPGPSPAPDTLPQEFYMDYRTHGEYTERLERIVSTYSAYVTRTEIGRSWLDHPLYTYDIQGSSDATPQFTIALTCMLHAREWLTAPSCIYAIERLAKAASEGKSFGADAASSTNPSVFPNNVRVKIFPIVNPDGYIYSHDDRTHQWQRKNIGVTSLDQIDRWNPGVDLNRNFSVGFNNGQSTDDQNLNSDVYVGEAAFSEKESLAVKRMFDENTIHVHFDVHTYSALVLPMWSYDQRDNRNWEANLGGSADAFTRAHNVGRLVNNAMNQCHSKPTGEDYFFQEFNGSNLLYDAGGVNPDWTTDAGAMGFTIELRPSQGNLGGFFPDPSGGLIKESGDELLTAIERSMGAIGNGETGNGPWQTLSWTAASCTGNGNWH